MILPEDIKEQALEKLVRAIISFPSDTTARDIANQAFDDLSPLFSAIRTFAAKDILSKLLSKLRLLQEVHHTHLTDTGDEVTSIECKSNLAILQQLERVVFDIASVYGIAEELR